jgi:uncharacterized protein (TIGR03437 family)
MFRGLALFLFLTPLSLPGGNVQLLPALPNAASTTALQLDSAGNIYVAGSYTPAPKARLSMTSAFVAKLSSDGSKVVYFTPLGGSSTDAATAIAVGSDGSAYITGNTNSTDFPVTAGAFQSSYVGGGQTQGFLVKVNPSGAIANSTFINGAQSSLTQMSGVAVNAAGEVLLTGIGGPGYTFQNNQSVQGFLLKLDPGMAKVLLSTYGYGGGPIVLDPQGNIYLAGSELANVPSSPYVTLSLPPFPAGSFQPTHDARFCFTLSSGPGGPGGLYSCRYQYVAKLNAAGTLLWGTYVTGTYGANAAGMAVDSAGNVIVAGTTNSDDYPVTQGSFQTAYTAAAPTFPIAPGSTFSAPPPFIGYVTKINATGSGLIWSTYFGGSYSDQITGMAVGTTGDIFVSGLADSGDLPGLEDTPDGCRPFPNQVLGFVARLAANGATAGPTQLVTGSPNCDYLTCTPLAYYIVPNYYQTGWPLALRPDGTWLTAGANGALASVDFSSTSRLTCVVDPADNVQLRSVAPGQLISLFGADLAPAAPFTPPSGVAQSTARFGVSFNGIPAPILYSSAQQVNVQVPYAISGETTVQIQVVDNQNPLSLSETHTMGVVERQPTIFLSQAASTSPFPGYTVCGGTMSLGESAVALNADGTVNDCTHPAVAGSVVTVFVNGLGPVTPALSTGAITQAPLAELIPGVDTLDPRLAPIMTTTTSVPGSISGLAQVQFQLPPALTAGPYTVTPSVSGVTLRERLFVVWVRPS